MLYLSLLAQFDDNPSIQIELNNLIKAQTSDCHKVSLSFFNGSIGFIWLIGFWSRNGFIDIPKTIADKIRTIDGYINTRIFQTPYIYNLDPDFFAIPSITMNQWRQTKGLQRLSAEEQIIRIIDDCLDKFENRIFLPISECIAYLHLIDFCVTRKIHTVKSKKLQKVIKTKLQGQYLRHPPYLAIQMLIHENSIDHVPIELKNINEIMYWVLLYSGDLYTANVIKLRNWGSLLPQQPLHIEVNQHNIKQIIGNMYLNMQFK